MPSSPSAAGVKSVALAGSRRAGDPTPLSDWDFEVAVDDHVVGSKQLRGQDDLAQEELDKMWHALLQPIGVAQPLSGVAAAVNAYIAARDLQAHQLGVKLDHRLERQVRAALTQNRVITGGDTHDDGADG